MADIARALTETTRQLQTFICPATAVAIGNNKSMLSIVNTGTKKVSIRKIYIVNSQTTAVTGVISIFQLRKITGHSAGTTLTPVAMDSTDSLDSGVTVRTGSTVSGESSDLMRQWLWSSDDWGTGTTDVEATAVNHQQTIPLYEVGVEEKPIMLNTNEGITIKHTVNSTAGTFDLAILFTQE